MDTSERAVRFVRCLSCLGHGHFTLPGQKTSFEVFSLYDAFEQLKVLSVKYRISQSDQVRLANEIRTSGLPQACRPDVEEYIHSFWKIETWAACYSYDEESRPKTMTIESDDLALAVHEYILQSSGRPLQLH